MKHRPIWFDINPLHLTIAALVSILHRLSGILLFVLIPWMLWLLQRSLHSEQQFELLKVDFQRIEFKFFISVLMFAFLFHFIAGIRHMLADIHIGEKKMTGKLTAGLVIALFVILGVGVLVLMQ